MLIFDHPIARGTNLFFNVTLASAVPWLQLPRSIIGDLDSYQNPPQGYDTELAAFGSLSSQVVGSVLRATVSLPVIGRLFRQSSGPVLSQRAPNPQHANEAWFFINGICTDTRVAAVNVAMLERMFERPVNLLHNATDGFLTDLLECAAGKNFDAITDAVAENLMPLVQALADASRKRVILLSHSQGTILASVMLKWLDEVLTPRAPQARQGAGVQKLSPERHAARRLAGKEGRHKQHPKAQAAEEFARQALRAADISKLELYCFANCATSMSPIAVSGPTAHYTPWIESYGNEYDLVARLGVLSPPHGVGSARIDGERYRRDKTWGHMLNAHYLIPMLNDINNGSPASGLSAVGENLRQTPRLWEYYKGKTPPAYP